MKRVRVIPVLLMTSSGLVKSKKFKDYKYVRIFNDKQVDELAIIDITASKEKRTPDLKRISEIAQEAFMPLAYGGGITSLQQAKEIMYNGIEKIILNKSAVANPVLIEEIAGQFGSQSVVISVDVKKNLFGKYGVYIDNGTRRIDIDVFDYVRKCEDHGAGEVLLTAIENDGTYSGYDLDIIRKITSCVSIPVIANGGASGIADFKIAILDGGASAVSAGSMFVFQRPHNAVLISYPSVEQLETRLYNQLP